MQNYHHLLGFHAIGINSALNICLRFSNLISLTKKLSWLDIESLKDMLDKKALLR